MIVALTYRLSRSNAELRREIRDLRCEAAALHQEVAALRHLLRLEVNP